MHVHVSEGKPTANATKIWITSTGKAFVGNNNSHIPPKVLGNIVRIIEARSDEIIQKWFSYFGNVSFYC